MTRSRKPTAEDLDRMSRCLALVTAYEMGAREETFEIFAKTSREILSEEEEMLELVRAMSQFSWILVKELSRRSRQDPFEVLDLIGKKFASESEKS